jgi:phosphoribosylanthranilate isomerase
MSIRVKVCGLTRPEDVKRARELGASFFGTILHPSSPRCVTIEQGSALLSGLPRNARVAVVVEPDRAMLEAIAGAGYGVVQVHFDPRPEREEAWKDRPAGLHLWLAPRLRRITDFSGSWLEDAAAILVDRYDPRRFGGTGEPGDWELFRKLRASWANRCGWILAGGLNPGNIERALAETGAETVDVNSGVESAPGRKDHRLLESFFFKLEAR